MERFLRDSAAGWTRLTTEHPELRFLAAGGLALAVWLALRTLQAIVHRGLSRRAPLTAGRLDDALAAAVGRTRQLFLFALGILAALPLLDVHGRIERFSRALALAICLVQAGIWGSFLLRELAERGFGFSGSHFEDPAGRTVGRMLGLAARVSLWTALVLVALSTFGVNITALIAGLGVGGVAVALAAQNVLGDLFASVAILLDKPFVLGDFIIVGDFMGTVEHLGIKTTRVRSLGGEEIIFANHDLLQSRVRNFKRMNDRRISFRLELVYQTPVEVVAQVPAMLSEIVKSEAGTRFDRAHFAGYGRSALEFEIVYYVLSADYGRYMDIQQAINLAILRRFKQEGIEFAYPTQTLLVATSAALSPPSS